MRFRFLASTSLALALAACSTASGDDGVLYPTPDAGTDATLTNEDAAADAAPRPCTISLAQACCYQTNPDALGCPTYDACGTLDPLWDPERTTVACDGYLMARVSLAESAEYFIYDATTLAIVAIGEVTATSNGIDCFAGPQGFVVPQTCGWEDPTPPSGESCVGLGDANADTASYCPLPDAGDD